MKRAQGFSLIELMLALALGVVVTAGIVTLFVGNNQTYTLLNGQSRMQENARFAVDFMTRSARAAVTSVAIRKQAKIYKTLNGAWNQTLRVRHHDADQAFHGVNNGNGVNDWTPSLTTLTARRVRRRLHRRQRHRYRDAAAAERHPGVAPRADSRRAYRGDRSIGCRIRRSRYRRRTRVRGRTISSRSTTANRRRCFASRTSQRRRRNRDAGARRRAGDRPRSVSRTHRCASLVADGNSVWRSEQRTRLERWSRADRHLLHRARHRHQQSQRRRRGRCGARPAKTRRSN